MNILLLMAMTLMPAADWPYWRGPSRDGHSPEVSGYDGRRWLTEKPLWQANVGEGCTSPLVVGDRLYTLGHAKGEDRVVCLEAATGKEIWASAYKSPRYGRYAVGDEGMYAGPTATPELAEGRLFTLGIDGDLHAWDATTGKKIWQVNLYDRYRMPRRPKVGKGGQQRDYGYTAAPLVNEGNLLVEAGGNRGTVVALDPATGKERWASACKDLAGHTGGMASMKVEGIPCVVLMTLDHMIIIRLDKGQEGQTLHHVPWATEWANSIAGPGVAGSSVIVTSGYNIAKIARFDVTRDRITKVWEKPMYSKACTPVIQDGHVYWAWKTVHCLDFGTGEQRWQGGDFADPGSMIVTRDDRLIVWGGMGKLALVETAKRSPHAYSEVARLNRVATTHAWPHVALAEGRVIVKDRKGNLKVFTPAR
jgi:outer membrane protein assembly factor BamB